MSDGLRCVIVGIRFGPAYGRQDCGGTGMQFLSNARPRNVACLRVIPLFSARKSYHKSTCVISRTYDNRSDISHSNILKHS